MENHKERALQEILPWKGWSLNSVLRERRETNPLK